jgi:hypothetical protein
MSVSGAAARVRDVEKRLKREWAEVRAHWHDDNARQFDEELVQPMLVRLGVVARALQVLNAALCEVRRDCE